MGYSPIRSGRLDASPKHSLFLFITEQHNSRSSHITDRTQANPYHTNSAQHNMYFGKSITVAVVSALSLVSSVLAIPDPAQRQGLLPGHARRGAAATHATATKGETLASASSHCVRKRRCSCSPPVTQCAGFGICLAGVAAPVCITDVNVLNGNSVIITHLF